MTLRSGGHGCAGVAVMVAGVVEVTSLEEIPVEFFNNNLISHCMMDTYDVPKM